MSDSTAPASNTETTGQEQNSFQAITSQADLDKIIGDRLARERAKYGDYDQLKAKAAKLDEMEESSKSELQKLQERLSEAEAAVKAHEQAQQIERWRDEVSQETGVPAKALYGNTLEELQAHAEVLAPLLAPNHSTVQRTIIREREPDTPIALNSDELTESILRAVGR